MVFLNQVPRNFWRLDKPVPKKLVTLLAEAVVRKCSSENFSLKIL